MRTFFTDWHLYGFRVALYNLGFRIVHRHDANVRVWQQGEECPGCDKCGWRDDVRGCE
jgi:hypothetical protein